MVLDCSALARMFWVVARLLIRCSGWLLGCCYVVARLLRVVTRLLQGCFCWLPKCYGWLLGGCSKIDLSKYGSNSIFSISILFLAILNDQGLV